MRFPRIFLFLLAWLAVVPLRAAEAPAPENYATVTIDQVKTSIYVGSVTMTIPTLKRDGSSATYASTYKARVFPYFFYNENGTFSITLPDGWQEKMARGERVLFTGEGMSADKEPRKIEGHADPADAVSGKIKVRVWVSPKIELIFNSTYRFAK